MQDATQQLIANINQLAANIQAGKTADKNYEAIKDANAKNLQAVQETNDTNYKIAMETNLLNRQWSLEDWSRQVAYNDPSYQKRLYAAAGYRYNPDGSGITSPEITTPTAAAATMQPMAYQAEMFDPNNNLPTTMLNGLSVVNNAFVAAGQVEQMRHQNDLIDAQGVQTQQLVKNLASQMLGQDLQNWLTEQTKGMSVENANLVNGQIQSQIAQTQSYLNTLDRQCKMLDLQLSFNPKLYTHMRNLWKSEEASAQYKASLDKFLLGQSYKWNDKESQARYDLLLAQGKKLLEEVRSSELFNSDEMYNIGVNHGIFTNGILREQMQYQIDINNAKVKFGKEYIPATTLLHQSGARSAYWNAEVTGANSVFERQSWFVGLNHSADFISKLIGPAYIGRAMFNMYGKPITPPMSGGISPIP